MLGNRTHRNQLVQLNFYEDACGLFLVRSIPEKLTRFDEVRSQVEGDTLLYPAFTWRHGEPITGVHLETRRTNHLSAFTWRHGEPITCQRSPGDTENQSPVSVHLETRRTNHRRSPGDTENQSPVSVHLETRRTNHLSAFTWRHGEPITCQRSPGDTENQSQAFTWRHGEPITGVPQHMEPVVQPN
ncbi:unnamed protein product [Boreogadus saida]